MRNTCVRFLQTGCITQVVALFIISQDRQTRVLAAVAMTRGQEVNCVHVEREDFALFLVLIIGLSTNCVCSYML